MMYRAVLQKSIKVPGGRRRRHISHVSTDRVWISDSEGNLILTNTKGKELDRVTDIGSGYGGHTVNRECDLIYIDREKNINKLSSENKEKTTIKQYNTAPWRPQCVYSSPSTGDLLVGMYRRDAETGKILRYNSTGENIQTIQNDNTGQELYKEPNYITENHNGDIIVSDWYRLAVVVTDRDGRYRFSYTGPPSGSRLRPLGICTDALSHILVCDFITRSVQMLDSKGNYLTEIQSQQHGIDRPYGLSYNDDDTHLLWVGSWNNNTVNIYRVVDTDSLTGLPLENVICNRHPRGACSKFCMQCEVPLCEECVTSTDHGRHNIKDVEMMFNAIHKKKDLDAVLKCLLLCHSCKINLNEEQWKKKFYTVAKFSKFKKIKKESILETLDEYKPILQQKDYEVMFSCKFFRHTSFLRFARDLQFVDIFLTWADKDNIAEYCRSWAYPKKENEVFCWLSPQQTERLIEKLGKDIFTHPTWQDTSIHDAAFSKFGIPMQVIMRGENSVKVFLENLKKGERTIYHTSGMIIGCAGSGKTTLLERLKGISVKKVKKYVKSTRGIELQSDIFDVSDTIKVNLSNLKQRFQIKIDETTRHQSVPEFHVQLTDDRKAVDIDEQEDIKITSSEEVYEKLKRNSAENDSINKNEQGSAIDEKERVVKKHEKGGLKGLGILQFSEDDFAVPEKKITILDFAGQCAYYASHQIFLSPRAFFILVLNMEKTFDDQVGEEVCSQAGSIFQGWTHRAKSIHQYSSEKAPVILVATHAEKKTEKEKIEFFREVWKTLEMKDKSLQRHLDKSMMFAVGFHDNKCIKKIKRSIADTVQKLDYWAEKLPLSWAMFEKFFQEKKYLKIIKKGILQAFNEALPKEIKLETIEDINIMLLFFHDFREILYFNQELLREIIILDVQWFADAFKNVITDKNHAEEDLLEFATEWDGFNETGELSDTLLFAIWNKKSIKDNAYLEHKDNIMLYMERLGLLAALGDKKWYVPCMNKRPFPAKSFASYPASSILCYVFDVLPAGIFQRLVASCIQIPWSLNSNRDELCIYQTVAVFLFENQNILIGMTSTEIQLQVFVLEGEVDKSTSQQVKKKIDDILNILSETFHADSKFGLAFKCKDTGFCDNKESSVINESEFTKPIFQCPSCPIEKKHIIKSKDVTKFWIQEHGIKTEISQAMGTCRVSCLGSSEQSDSLTKDNFAKIQKLLQIATDAVRICFDKFFPKEDLEKTLKENEPYMRTGQFRFLPPQLEILFPPQGGPNTGVSSLSMDVTIMYKLLRNFSDIDPPGNGWGKEPKVDHIAESDDIERIRLYRNKSSHDALSKPFIKDDVFNVIWTDLSQAILRLSGDVLKRRISAI